MDIRTRSKAVSIVIIAALILFTIVGLSAPPSSAFPHTKIRTSEDVISFLSELGWDTSLTGITMKDTTLPEQLDETFINYNTIQLKQNCDLTAYLGKPVTIYTAEITNYNTSDTVYATIIVHKGTVIGGDIHSASMDGFMHTLK